MSLRARMMALFLGLGVLPLVALGVVSYRKSTEAVQELLAAQTAAIARRSAAELESRYSRYQSDLSLLAENLETLSLFRAHYADGGGAWETAFAPADAYLRRIWDQYRVSYRWVELRDTAGVVVYALGEKGSPSSSGAELSGPDQQEGLPFSRSVPDPGGSGPLGSVVALAPRDQVIPPDALAPAFGRSGYSVVLDRLGDRVLFHPRRSSLHGSASSLLGPEGWGVTQESLARDSGSFVFRLADSVRVASFVNLESPAWTVLATTAVDEFSAPFSRTRRLQLTIVVLVSAAVLVAFLVMTGQATRSLERLTQAADAVAEGDYSPPLPPAGSDEVGRLSAAFKVMTGRVEETLRRIQESRHMAVIGEFTSRLSHEIRNPLTSVKLNLQRIERHTARGRLPEECLSPLKISLSEVDRLDRVVRGVLSLARSGAPPTDPCSVHEVLLRTTATLHPQLEGSGIEVESDLAAPVDTVLGNAEALEGMFLNLFLNAVDAMPEGGRIRVSTVHVPDLAVGRIRVKVEDTGPGVPGEIADRIFDPFFSTKGEGTGFGLSVALSTVEDHGGAIRLDESTGDGEGAVFVIELPLAAPGGGNEEEGERP